LGEIEDRRQRPFSSHDRAAWSRSQGCRLDYQRIPPIHLGVFAAQACNRVAGLNRPVIADSQVAQAQAGMPICRVCALLEPAASRSGA
jgi:hypothetical protein